MEVKIQDYRGATNVLNGGADGEKYQAIKVTVIVILYNKVINIACIT